MHELLSPELMHSRKSDLYILVKDIFDAGNVLMAICILKIAIMYVFKNTVSNATCW